MLVLMLFVIDIYQEMTGQVGITRAKNSVVTETVTRLFCSKILLVVHCIIIFFYEHFILQK
jgi:hypothetical protein